MRLRIIFVVFFFKPQKKLFRMKTNPAKKIMKSRGVHVTLKEAKRKGVGVTFVGCTAQEVTFGLVETHVRWCPMKECGAAALRSENDIKYTWKIFCSFTKNFRGRLISEYHSFGPPIFVS